MNKKVIIGIVVIVVVFIIFQTFFKKGGEVFEFATVERGNVVQEVSETGQVQKGDKISLSFEISGKISAVYVQEGSVVGAGAILAKLNTTEFQIKLQDAEAALSLAQAELDKLVAGAGIEEIQVSQAKLSNKQVALNTAEQDLEDAYEDALNTLDASYLTADNAKNKASDIQRAYFTGNDQESLAVKEGKVKIEAAVTNIKIHLDTAKDDSSHNNTNLALSQTKNELSDTSDALSSIRDTVESLSYRDTVSAADKTLLDTHRDNINDASVNTVNAQQAITSAALALDSAKSALNIAKDELALILADPREEDLSLKQAKVNQAKAQVSLLENQIEKAYLRSPVSGQVAEIKKRVGELVQQDVAITFLPLDPFEIKVDIYEEDVVKVNVGNVVDIALVAFPGKVFAGKVISIDPAEKLIDGVVYYEVVVIFSEMPENIKPGMTADIVIKTDTRENVLVLPEHAVEKIGGKWQVEVLVGNEVQAKEIEIGLAEDTVEILSGLQEGDKVIIR